jgi:hypothetical protein
MELYLAVAQTTLRSFRAVHGERERRARNEQERRAAIARPRRWGGTAIPSHANRKRTA